MKIRRPNFNCEITASVGFVSPEDQPECFLIAHSQSKRGWDIPGGHCNPGETPIEAFIREAFEETNAHIAPHKCHEIARLDCGNGTGISVFDASCEEGEYSGNNQVESDGGIDDVAAVSDKKIIELYFGNKELLKNLLEIVLENRKLSR